MKTRPENTIANVFSRPPELIKFDSESDFTDLIIDLEHLRRRKLSGSTPFELFMEIKIVFHLLESFASARLEGNRTTLAELIEENINPPKGKINEKHLEIRNNEATLQYIDEYLKDGKNITEAFIREIHKKIVQDLTPQSRDNPDGEGDPTPGKYRQKDIVITGSELKPPQSGALVASNMTALVSFIQEDTPAKYDLLKIAIAHHRFAATHPFHNGNGRTVRALTYAMLLKQGFSVGSVGRILNPTAIFCNDRDTYIKHLTIADRGTDADLLTWAEYVVRGLKEEIEKIDRLTEFRYVRDNLILPAIQDSLERKSISDEQSKVLDIAARSSEPIMSRNLIPAFPDYSDLKRTRLLGRMVELKLLRKTHPNSRQYVIALANSYLLRGVIEQLSKLGFIPASLK